MFNKLMIGGDEEIPLPDTRRKAFCRYGKEHFGKLVLFGVLAALFFVPSAAWLFVMNYGKAVAVAALDKQSATYAAELARILLGNALTKYLTLIPLLMLFFVGLSGLFSAVKRISFGQSCKVSHFFGGIRENFLRFALAGLIFGISLFFVCYNVTYLFTVKVGFGTAMLFAVTVLQFVFCSIFTCWFLTGTTIYSAGLLQTAKNALVLTVAKLFKNLIMIVCLSVPIISMLLIPSPFGLLAMAVVGIFYGGFAALGLYSYSNYVYDRTINKKLGGDCIGRGLLKTTDAAACALSDIGGGGAA